MTNFLQNSDEYVERQNKGEKKLITSRKKAANISSDVTGLWETRLEGGRRGDAGGDHGVQLWSIIIKK